jgi:hypothetical protein
MLIYRENVNDFLKIIIEEFQISLLLKEVHLKFRKIS